MKKTKPGVIFWIVLIAGLGTGVFFLFFNKPKKDTTNDGKKIADLSMDELINQITTNPKSGTDNSSVSIMATFDKGYLQAWLTGLVNKLNVFTYAGKLYNTNGGKAIV